MDLDEPKLDYLVHFAADLLVAAAAADPYGRILRLYYVATAFS